MTSDLWPLNVAIEHWEHAGMECCVAPGYSGFNGYVRLPEDHPQRVWISSKEAKKKALEQMAGSVDLASGGAARIAYAVAELANWDEEQESAMDHNIGYDEIEVSVHGGLTYGPNEDGWVGFDTGHAFDSWRSREVEKILGGKLGVIDAMPGFYIHQASNKPARFSRRLPMHNQWSLARLRAEVNNLAEQLADRSKG